MKSFWHRERQAFTLLEIMIVLALIGLLAVLAIPSFVKARKQSQGKRILNDARIIDAAVNQWVFETGQADGNAVDLASAASYTKTGTINPNDVLGNPYDIGPVGATQIMISAVTKTALSGVAIDWGPY
jgi:prepilin-type N-terminal cleavage/methylation domain-containing protein